MILGIPVNLNRLLRGEAQELRDKGIPTSKEDIILGLIKNHYGSI